MVKRKVCNPGFHSKRELDTRRARVCFLNSTRSRYLRESNQGYPDDQDFTYYKRTEFSLQKKTTSAAFAPAKRISSPPGRLKAAHIQETISGLPGLPPARGSSRAQLIVKFPSRIGRYGWERKMLHGKQSRSRQPKKGISILGNPGSAHKAERIIRAIVGAVYRILACDINKFNTGASGGTQRLMHRIGPP